MMLAEQLADARQQYHLLQTGQAATVFVDQNGEKIEFRAASAPRLSAYIADLERLVAGGERQLTYKFHTSKGLN